jgi:hypothetical protein
MKTFQLTSLKAVAMAILLAVPITTLAQNNSEPKYQLTIKDAPSAKRFNLTLRSLDDRAMCMHIQRWPNRFGRVHFGQSWITMHSAHRLFRARDENLGRCVGPTCIIHIAPKGVLRGFISYSVFGGEHFVERLKDRHLQVDVQPKLCTAAEFQQRHRIDTD